MRSAHTIFKNVIAAALSVSLLLLPSLSQAAGSKDFGQYEVHWNVFPSAFLTPEVAKANELTRSRAIGIVNISIMERTENGGLKTVPGQVDGKAINDIRQTKFLSFRRIKEGDAVYFIAQYQYRHGELMTFQIDVLPQGATDALPIRFAHTLFND